MLIMKKTSGLLVILSLLLILAACGTAANSSASPAIGADNATAASGGETPAEGGNTDAINSAGEANKKPEAAEGTEEQAPIEASTGSASPSDLVDSDGAIEAAASSGEESLILGTTKDGTYTNTFIGVGCVLGDEWTYYTDEQIREMNGIALDALDDEIANMVKQAEIIYDMTATADEGNVSINILFQNLSKFGDIEFSESDFVDAGIEGLKMSLESMGLTINECTRVEVKFAGSDRYATYVHSTYEGIDIYQEIIYIMKDGYVCCITLVCKTANNLSKLADCFYVLE